MRKLAAIPSAFQRENVATGPRALILSSAGCGVTCALDGLVVQGTRVSDEGLRSLFWGLVLFAMGKQPASPLAPGCAAAPAVPERDRAPAAASAGGYSRSTALIKSTYLLHGNRIFPAASLYNGELHSLSSPFPIKSFLV